MTTRITKDEDPMDVARAAVPDAPLAEQLYECANCGAKYRDGEMDEITGGFWERHEPGDTVAAGECPKCGALCFPEKKSHIVGQDDATLHVLDLAMNAAESKLQKMLATRTPTQITEMFREYLDIHLQTELAGAIKYGRNVRAFRRAVNSGKESAF